MMHPAFASAAKRRAHLNRLLKKKPFPLVAPTIGERYRVLVHRSTRKKGWWQATFFEGDEPIGDSESPSWARLLEHIHMDSVDWSRAKAARARPNEFRARPPEFSGPVAGGTAQYPGFHTASDKDTTYAYAQMKSVPEALGRDYDEQSSLEQITIADYPAVVAIDMQGLTQHADFDAIMSVRPIIVDVARMAVDESEDDPLQALLDYVEMGDFGDRDVPTQALEWLFEYGSSVVLEPASSLLSFAETHDDPGEFLRMLGAGKIDDEHLASITGQFRYVDDVRASRIVQAWLVAPWWPTILDEIDDELMELADRLEHNGWSIITMEDVGSHSLSTSEQSVFEHKEPNGARIEYHGTSYLNLLSAAPHLKLAVPPRPYR